MHQNDDETESNRKGQGSRVGQRLSEKSIRIVKVFSKLLRRFEHDNWGSEVGFYERI